jgi:hypothetical protein
MGYDGYSEYKAIDMNLKTAEEFLSKIEKKLNLN